MERTYIQMPVMNENNPNYSFGSFRVSFYGHTGMKIPATCSKNEQETHYLTGELKTHLTQNVIDTLKAEFPMVTVSNGWPQNWVTKEG